MAMELSGTITAIQNLWQSFLGYLPGLIGAIVLLIVGWIVGRIFGRVTREILDKADVDEYIKREGHLNFRLTSISDVIVRWVIYLAFIAAATRVLGIAGLTSFVNSILFSILPGIVGAAIAMLIAYMVGIYFKEGLTEHEEGEESAYADLSGKAVFWLSMFFGVALALDIFFKLALQAGVSLVPNLLMIMVAGVSLGGAIAIGLGLKDVVSNMAKDYAEEFKEKRE